MSILKEWVKQIREEERRLSQLNMYLLSEIERLARDRIREELQDNLHSCLKGSTDPDEPRHDAVAIAIASAKLSLFCSIYGSGT